MSYLPMADAAFAANIPPGFDIAAGYIGGPLALNIWTPQDWARFPGYRLPIWQTMDGPKSGVSDGGAAVKALRALRVPEGCITALALETSRDVTYVESYGGILHAAGYRTWVCGAASTVGGNPPLNGYWVEDFTSDMGLVHHLLVQPHVRAVQYATTPGYDSSLVKAWTEGEMWHG